MQYGTKTYIDSAGEDNVITTKAAILHRIIIGADVASGVVEVSDHVSDGDGNVIIKLTSSTMLADTGGVVEVDAHFNDGITLDLTNQTDVTVVWSPSGH